MSDNISTIYGSSFLLSLMPISLSIDVENVNQELELDLEHEGSDNYSSHVVDDNGFNSHDHKHDNKNGNTNDNENNIDFDIFGKKAIEDEVEKEVEKSTESGTFLAHVSKIDHDIAKADDEEKIAKNSTITIGNNLISNLVVPMRGDSGDMNRITEVSGSTEIVAITDIKDKNQSSSFVKNKCMISGYVSRVSTGIGRSDNDRQFIFCNGRPVDLPKFSKALNEVRRDIF